MFDEDKINELLRGASSKKKTSSSKKKMQQSKDSLKEESKRSTPKENSEITSDRLQEIESMIGSGTGMRITEVPQTKQKEKPVSIKNIQQRQEYIHERKLAEDRLRRLKQAENRIEELERTARGNLITDEQKNIVQQMQADMENKALIFQEQQNQMEKIISQQKEQIQTLMQEKEVLTKRCKDLHNVVDLERSHQQEGKEITQVFQEHGLHGDEYRDVISWLIKTGMFPLSYIQTQHYDLLQQILHDKCHIQAANIPLPKESNDLYIDASLERCPLSGGQDIVVQARLFKDECLIHGYTTIVMFGTQGEYEPLFQVLFAHHALRVTLSPPLTTLPSQDADQLIEANQLAFSWGESVGFEVNYTSKTKTVGGFLHDLVSYLRSML
ncbi:MAG: hypothetical protein CL916_04520 [Deltaproteobacteria bacterium]|nr:hypothetical protein [Deltaproteobacteria bacterium]